MAYGILKKRYLSELRDAPPPQSYEERAAARAAEDQLTGTPLLAPKSTLKWQTPALLHCCAH